MWSHDHKVECLDANVVLGFVEGRLDSEALVATDAHLAICGDCREVVAALAHGSSPAASGDGGIAGGRVGRYVLLETIGRGGMGVVHAAWDPELDRRIAIKLLRSDLDEDHWKQARARLLREGRAIARLAHPNVVAVHDVGEFDDGVFVAMEYVEGGTLASWGDGRRTADEVIAVFEQAARGIAAAHRAGLVHRDVKPSNVLVGTDGRVRVVDFGLARAPGATGDGGAGTSDPVTSLTSTGILVGTPLYMAPETMAGASADERSDQFGFAASLYEILSGARPFAGSTIDELRRAKQDQALVPPVRRVPPRVMSAIRRALAPDPAARWPSMDRLADRLASHLHRRRRWLVAAGVATAVVAIGMTIVAASAPGDDRCSRGADRIAGSLDRAALRTALGPIADRVTTRLDGYERDWIAGYRRVCEATHVRGEQSEALLDVRMRCLDARRTALAALARVLVTRTDATTRANAVAAVGSLAPISDCDAIDALAVLEPPPLQLGPQLESAQRLVDEAEALERAGHFADGLAKLRTLPALGYRALDARVALLRGDLEHQLGDYKAAETSLLASAQAAAEARDDLTAARAWTLLVGVVGFLDNRPAEGLALARIASAAVARAGAADTAGAELESMRGLVFDALGDFVEARAHHERALAIRERTLGRDHLEVAQVLDNLGAIPLQQHRYDEAEPHYARALDIRRRALGEDHPDVAASWNSLGTAQRGLRRLDLARASYEQAYAIWRRSLGDDHANVASALNNLGNLERELDRPADAERHLEAAVATWRRLDARAHAADIATAVANLGNLAYDRGDRARARARLVEALALLEAALGKQHPRLATPLDNLAHLELEAGERAVAEPLYARALALREAALGKDHVDLADSLVGLGECRLAGADPAGAIPLLERALALHAGKPDAHTAAVASFALARALWDANRDRSRARALAERARSAPRLAKRVDRWLAEHR